MTPIPPHSVTSVLVDPSNLRASGITELQERLKLEKVRKDARHSRKGEEGRDELKSLRL